MDKISKKSNENRFGQAVFVLYVNWHRSSKPKSLSSSSWNTIQAEKAAILHFIVEGTEYEGLTELLGGKSLTYYGNSSYYNCPYPPPLPPKSFFWNINYNGKHNKLKNTQNIIWTEKFHFLFLKNMNEQTNVNQLWHTQCLLLWSKELTQDRNLQTNNI